MNHLSYFAMNLSQVVKTENLFIFDTSDLKARSSSINPARRRIMVTRHSWSRLNFLRLSFFLSGGDDKSFAVLATLFHSAYVALLLPADQELAEMMMNLENQYTTSHQNLGKMIT